MPSSTSWLSLRAPGSLVSGERRSAVIVHPSRAPERGRCVEMTPIGHGRIVVRDDDEPMDVVAFHPYRRGFQRCRAADRQRRAASSDGGPARPVQLAHSHSVARARTRSVWLITPTTSPASPTTGSPLMSYSSISRAASVSDAVVAIDDRFERHQVADGGRALDGRFAGVHDGAPIRLVDSSGMTVTACSIRPADRGRR